MMGRKDGVSGMGDYYELLFQMLSSLQNAEHLRQKARTDALLAESRELLARSDARSAELERQRKARGGKGSTQ